jgi:transcription elongation GreA/GreB family factor
MSAAPPEGIKKRFIEQLKAHFEAELTDAASRGLGPEQIDPIKRALLMYRFLPVRPAAAGDVVEPGSLVEIETPSIPPRRSWILIVPQNGGLVTDFDGAPAQVLTPQSPLGEALMGKQAGDPVEIRTSSGSLRSLRIVSIH